MGKAQSKRSVDITTETKKGAEDEVTEKMEKIEDLDTKEVLNGDATSEEKQNPLKKDNEETESDKDMTTEKNVDIQAGGDSTEASNSAETPKDEGGETATAEEISPLGDESIKKSKKEKVKKKWSFRSISFGKKDKQKPSKNEEALDDGTPATNGAETDEKSSNETEDPQKEKNVNEEVEKSTENRENGDATQQELNGTEHKEEMMSEEKSNVLTANSTNNTNTERCAPVQSVNTVESSEQSEKTEPAVTSITNNETNISENNTTNEASENGNGEFEELNATEQDLQKPDITTASVEKTSTEKINASTDATNELSTSPSGEKIHQNGDNIVQEIIEQSKAQIEVNSKTENKVIAATLDYFPSTSINPSNTQIQIQDLNESTKNVDENFKINIDQSVNSKFTDLERVECPLILPTSSISESVKTVEDIDYNKQIEESALLPTEIIETEKPSTVNKITEPSPPPLPISPPPSQVSVFAFTNNEESVEDSLPTNNNKPGDDSTTINEENKEILYTHSELLPDSSSLENYIQEKNESSYETNETTNMRNEVINDSVENKLIGEKTSFDENMLTNNLTHELKNDEISIAAAVINEITEHAAEIVSHHLKNNEYESLHTAELKKDSDNKIVNEVEKADHERLAEGNNVDTITDSSLTLSPKESPQAQNEMISMSVEER